MAKRTLKAAAELPAWQGRNKFLVAALLALALVMGGRLVWVQAIEGNELRDAASTDRTQNVTLYATRGDIVDRNGEIMATSTQRYNVGVNQLLVGDYVLRDADTGEPTGYGHEAAAAQLAPILDVNAEELGADLVGESSFQYIARNISVQQWHEIAALNIPGIEPEPITTRTYPNDTTAGNVLGFVGRDGYGLAGIEQTFNEELTGENGMRSVEIGAQGQVIPSTDISETPATPGQNVQLTIDRDLQFHTQEVVDQAADQHNAAWGAAVVVEIDTGAILALADTDTVDPGNYEDWDPEDRGSRAITNPYEPGSSGKIPTFAAALDAGGVEMDDTWYAPYRITMPNGQSFRDNSEHAATTVTTAGALALSYNTPLIQIGDTLSDETRFEYFEGFGLGQPTGVELPGESGGILTNWESWDNRSRYTNMFGQSVAVTVLQSALSGAIVGNGGVRPDLHLVNAVADESGEYVPVEYSDGEQVIDEDTAADMLVMMEGATHNPGTATTAQLDGYRVAGKTGTAQIPDENGNLTNRAGTFVGVVPADDPQYAMAVVMYDVSSPGYGSVVAAPVFADTMEFALPHYGVTPSEGEPPREPLGPGWEWQGD